MVKILNGVFNANNQTEEHVWLIALNSANAIIEKSCAKLGLSFEKIDKFIENIWDVEDSINNADLVIGIGRSLYDAMACGRPVIFFDSRDYSQNLGNGYLTQKTIQQSILYNCSGRFSKKHFNANSLAKELKKFNTNDGYFFRNYAITHLNIKKSVDEYLKLVPKHLLLWKLKKISSSSEEIFTGKLSFFLQNPASPHEPKHSRSGIFLPLEQLAQLIFPFGNIRFKIWIFATRLIYLLPSKKGAKAST